MSEGGRVDVDASRTKKAVVVVSLVVLLALCLDPLLGAAGLGESSGISGAEGVGLDAGALIEGHDAFESLAKIEEAASTGETTVPQVFLEEVGVLPGAQDIRSMGNGTVVGYVVDGESQEVMDLLDESLRKRGWKAVPMGLEGGATFIKSGGRCTWALATCTQMGSSVSVVLRSVIT